MWSDNSIPGYRGTPGGDEEERFWNPEKPPCVPSDHRPAHLFSSEEAARAAGAASRVEHWAFRPDEDGEDEDFNVEEYEVACVRHKHALRRLRESYPVRSPRSTIPGRARAGVGLSQCGHGWSRPNSWASVTAGWLAGSSYAGAVSGSRPDVPISRGDRVACGMHTVLAFCCEHEGMVL